MKKRLERPCDIPQKECPNCGEEYKGEACINCGWFSPTPPEASLESAQLAGSLQTIDTLLETTNPSKPAHTWENFSLKQEVKKAEARFIKRALRDAGGSVSKASRLLGFNHHQSLISLLDKRHKDLAGLRSTKRRRARTVMTKPAQASPRR